MSKKVKLIPCLKDDWFRLRYYAVVVRTQRILFGGHFLAQCLKVQLSIIWTSSQWDDIRQGCLRTFLRMPASFYTFQIQFCQGDTFIKGRAVVIRYWEMIENLRT